MSVLQQLPRNQAVHTLQEKFPAGLALLALVFQIGKGWLVHTTSFPVSISLFSLTMPHLNYATSPQTCSEYP